MFQLKLSSFWNENYCDPETAKVCFFLKTNFDFVF